MLGSSSNIGNINAAQRPINGFEDIAVSVAKNDFVNVDETDKFQQLAKELDMSPKALRQAIDDGTIDQKKLIEALQKVTKAAAKPGVAKAVDEKSAEKARIGKVLDIVAKQLDYPNFEALVADLPQNKTKTIDSVIDAVVKTGLGPGQAFNQIKPPSFKQALDRRIERTGAEVNTAA